VRGLFIFFYLSILLLSFSLFLYWLLRWHFEKLGILTHQSFNLLHLLFITNSFIITTFCPIFYIACCTLCFLLSACLSVHWQDILFCNFWSNVGSCELQMCMAFRVGIKILDFVYIIFFLQVNTLLFSQSMENQVLIKLNMHLLFHLF